MVSLGPSVVVIVIIIATLIRMTAIVIKIISRIVANGELQRGEPDIPGM